MMIRLSNTALKFFRMIRATSVCTRSMNSNYCRLVAIASAMLFFGHETLAIQHHSKPLFLSRLNLRPVVPILHRASRFETRSYANKNSDLSNYTSTAFGQHATIELDSDSIVEVSLAKKTLNFLGFKRSSYDAEILALAIPTLGAVLIDPCLSLVDTIFVGRLGAVALGSIGPCTALFNFVFATASCVLMVSTSVIVAKYKATDNKAGMGRTIVIASSMGLFIGIFCGGMFCIFPNFFLGLMGAPESLMPLAVPYLKWRAAAMPASMFLLVAGGAFRGIGDPLATLRNGALVGLLNVVLDPLLMFTMNLGVAGAAIATGIAQFLGAFAYFIRIYSRRREFGFENNSESVSTKESWVPSFADAKEFVDAGSSLMLRQVCNVGCWTLMACVATRMGIYDIAAHQLMLSLWLVIAYAQDAVGVAGQVMVAQKLGVANDIINVGDAKKAVLIARTLSKRILQLSLLIGTFLAVASRIIIPWALPSVCKSVEVLKLVLRVFPMALMGFPLCCLVWTWDSLFYGASDFLYNARTIAISSTIASIGILAALRLNWGVHGLWMNMTFGYFLPRFYFHYRRFNDVRGPFGLSTSDLQRQLE